MVNVTTGLDALALLQGGNEGGGEHTNKFSKLNSGDSRFVKVLAFGDFVAAPTYSVFKKVNTFSPENPPTLSAKGFPTDNFTPFDKAWKYHQELSETMGDEHSQKAGQYRIKTRFAIGFYDLDAKECIVIDFSKTQAQSIISVIQKNEKKLGKRAFELEKVGSGTSTKVTLTALDNEDDLTEAQNEAFDNAPASFDKSLFDNLFFTQNEQQMVDALKVTGFDVSLIGYDAGQAVTSGQETAAPQQETAEDDPTQNF